MCDSYEQELFQSLIDRINEQPSFLNWGDSRQRLFYTSASNLKRTLRRLNASAETTELAISYLKIVSYRSVLTEFTSRVSGLICGLIANKTGLSFSFDLNILQSELPFSVERANLVLMEIQLYEQLNENLTPVLVSGIIHIACKRNGFSDVIIKKAKSLYLKSMISSSMMGFERIEEMIACVLTSLELSRLYDQRRRFIEFMINYVQIQPSKVDLCKQTLLQLLLATTSPLKLPQLNRISIQSILGY